MKSKTALGTLVVVSALLLPACKPADGVSFKRDAARTPDCKMRGKSFRDEQVTP